MTRRERKLLSLLITIVLIVAVILGLVLINEDFTQRQQTIKNLETQLNQLNSIPTLAQDDLSFLLEFIENHKPILTEIDIQEQLQATSSADTSTLLNNIFENFDLQINSLRVSMEEHAVQFEVLGQISQIISAIKNAENPNLGIVFGSTQISRSSTGKFSWKGLVTIP